MKAEVYAATSPRNEDEHALAKAWSALLKGEAKIVESFSTSDRMGLVLVEDRTAVACPVKPQHLRLWNDLLAAGQQKVPAINLRMSASTVTGTIQQTLRHIGLHCWPSRVPLLVVIAAHAAGEPAFLSSVRVAEQNAGDLLYRTLTIGAPEPWLSARLSPSESRVAGLRVTGKTHAEIGLFCRTSPRTVANQLGAVYRKLGVGSRLQLLLLLASEYTLGNVHGAMLDAPTAPSQAPIRDQPTANALRASIVEDLVSAPAR